MAKVTMSFTLDDETDRDLVRWLSKLQKGKRSEEIRQALRAGLEHGSSVTIEDVYQAVQQLERKLQNGAVAKGPPSGDDWDEPPEAAAALEKLGL